MAVTLSLQLKSGEAQRAIARLRRVAPQRIARALNRSADSAKTLLVREVAKDLGVSQTENMTRGDGIRDLIRVKHASGSGENLAALVSVSGARLPLSRFKARQTRNGVAANLGPGGGGRKQYPGTFLATTRSGHTGVWQRSGRKRLPIHQKYGPSLPHVFTKHQPAGQARGEEQLIKNLQHELKFALTSATS